MTYILTGDQYIGEKGRTEVYEKCGTYLWPLEDERSTESMEYVTCDPDMIHAGNTIYLRTLAKIISTLVSHITCYSQVLLGVVH